MILRTVTMKGTTSSRRHGSSFIGQQNNPCRKTARTIPFSGPTDGPYAQKTSQSHIRTTSRSLVQLPVREGKVVENESNINKKVLASAAVVCLATNFLTVQGLLLTAYAATLTAVPVGAVRHALKKRNAWPALFLLSSAILVPNIAVLRGAYTSLVNPVSVHLKARITLPAIVHAFVGSKHPILKGTLQAAQIISQIVLVGLLLQYLLAPKIAETMRQRAIMLCRALTTTESQGLKKERANNGKVEPEDWVQTTAQESPQDNTSDSFMGSITRGSPRRREVVNAGFQTKGKGSKRRVPLNLPEGQQPSIQDIYAHAGLEYAFANSQRSSHSLKEMAQGAEALQNADFQDLFETPSEEEIEQAKADLAELGLSFESDNEVAEDAAVDVDNPQLNKVVKSIGSTDELFTVLNEQLNMVQDLADEVRHKGIALKQSEFAREDLIRELKATVGERNLISKELSQLTLKFEAAQGMWEKHLEQGGSFSDLITEGVLDKVVDALNERKRTLLLDYVEVTPQEREDKDAIAAKFRVFPDETEEAKGELSERNNAQPFEISKKQREAQNQEDLVSKT